ncbi:interleukin-31 receptor subunit alpha isoform X1 [Cyprinodon tularosa]|uniref:interleukin-31 receptor subunit alpha isoform X1 n=1 Tax=Cyprinodon tularosa TaxID=77115 RepID=UPI0018E1EAB3|nr:interleukin-31 receptor subunit alpha isoform X1 [Cyprinodon tularosa]
MSGCGLQNFCSRSKYCLFGNSLHVLIFGLMVIPVTSHIRVASANCEWNEIAAKYENCTIRPDGVHHLDCFNKNRPSSKCTWEPGESGLNKSYTLILKQPRTPKPFCKVYYNLTQFYKEFFPSSKWDVIVEVLENTETTNCSKAAFRGSPQNMTRCGPPNNVLLSRPPGELKVNVSWLPEDIKYINNFSVRYKVLGSHSWNESVESPDKYVVKVEKLNPSFVYAVQIQCVVCSKCSQCPWSKIYTVPPELRSPPVEISSKYSEMTEEPGRRLITITWKYPVKDLFDGYRVTIWKECGEPPREEMNTTEPEIKLILSYSAYQLNISAYNNVSVSPAGTHIIPQHKDTQSLGDGRLNVTVHNSTAFTIHWRRALIRRYVCYSVEWMKKGHSAWYRSFFEDTNSSKTLSSLSEHLEPYQRYSVILHLRPSKNTCNIKHINNSESTYGTKEFYHIEGSPISAPTNISFHNVTVNSAVLQWSEIPEEDLRGFLLGYIIHYTEYRYMQTEYSADNERDDGERNERDAASTKFNVSVDPDTTSFNIKTLKSGTAYQVQISGFTSAGAGKRSAPSVFKTEKNVNFSISGAITVFIFVTLLLMFGSPLIKRVKASLWPSIPNPEHSDAVQKIEIPAQLELIEALAALKVEEWDTKSLEILEKEAIIPPQMSPSKLQLLRVCQDVGDSLDITHIWSPRDGGDDDKTDPLLDTPTTCFPSSPLAFTGGYTTMEMFQQLIPQGTVADSSNNPSMESTAEDLNVFTSLRLDYVRQFSTSPPSDSEHMSAIL